MATALEQLLHTDDLTAHVQGTEPSERTAREDLVLGAKDIFVLDPELESDIAHEIAIAKAHPLVEHFLGSGMMNPENEERDRITLDHSEGVAELVIAIAKKSGVPEDILRREAVGAFLHDIGKLAPKGTVMRDAVDNPGRLSDPEFEEMKKHPERGLKMYLAECGERGEDPDPIIVNMILLHHGNKKSGAYPDNTASVLHDSGEYSSVSRLSAADIMHSMATRSYVEGGNKKGEDLFYALVREAHLSVSTMREVLGLLDPELANVKKSETAHNIGFVAIEA